MTDIKPCPACGTMMELNGGKGFQFTKCKNMNCAVLGPWRETEADAIAASNALPRWLPLIEANVLVSDLVFCAKSIVDVEAVWELEEAQQKVITALTGKKNGESK